MKAADAIADGMDPERMTDLTVLATNAGMRDLLLAVERLHKSLQQAFEELLMPHDLSVSQWLVISGMAEDNGHTLTHFAQQLDRDAGSLSRAIHQLSRRGLLGHHREPRDRRSVRLLLTSDGQRIHRHVAPQIAKLKLALDCGQVDPGNAHIFPVLVDLAARIECCTQRKPLA